MTTIKKSANEKDLREPQGNPEQERENENIDKAIKKESESLSYPETVNDAEEKEEYDTGHDNGS